MSAFDLVQSESPPVSLAFKHNKVRMLTVSGDPWFVARDVCAALTIDWSGKTLSAIPRAWKGMGSLPTPSKSKWGGGTQRFTLISEPAVYKLAFRSNKPEADEFTNWVASEVLPAIRKTGRYQSPAPPQLPLVKALDKSYSTTLDGLSRARSAVFMALLDTRERKPFVILAKAFCDLAFLSDEAIKSARA